MAHYRGSQRYRKPQVDSVDGHSDEPPRLYDYTDDYLDDYPDRNQTFERRTFSQDGSEFLGAFRRQVNVTISEDTANGQTAKLDASLGLLGNEDVPLQLPGNEFDDEVEDSPWMDYNLDLEQPPSHDYRLNTERLRNQSKLLESRAAGIRRITGRRPGTFQSGRTDSVSMKKAKIFRIPSPSPSIKLDVPTARAFGAQKDSISAHRLHTRLPSVNREEPTVTASSSKKRKHNSGSQKNYSRRYGELDDAGEGRQILHPGAHSLPDHFELFYRIQCESDEYEADTYHPITIFRDAPYVSEEEPIDSRRHLTANKPMIDFDTYIENERDEISFMVIRTVECSHSSVILAKMNHSLRWVEQIYLRSQVSKTLLQKVATAYFQETIQQEDEGFLPVSKTAIAKSLERLHIHPANLFFYHHRQLLRNYVKSQPQFEPRVKALLQYLKTQFGDIYTEAEALFADGMVNQNCIGYLFKPNEVVVAESLGEPSGFVVQEWPKLHDDGSVTLNCWSLQADGSGFARKLSALTIPPLRSGEAAICDLAVYPIEYAGIELHSLLQNRGEHYWRLRTATQVTYKGWNVLNDQFFPDARFMIDHKTYHKMHSYAQTFHFNQPETTYPYDIHPTYLVVDETPTETCYQVMPPDIHGFYLNEKKWIRLFVEDVHPVSWNKKAFERLVLPSDTKDLIEALVTVRASQRGVKQGLGTAGKRTDITTGKGNGLIMLLHGGPGTGKTLTAESVAEIAEMPLYRVTCGDVGSHAEDVEKYLNTVLHLGKTWNCVLLLDDADVFLEERSISDLQRNSLVSVFLRVLEYYDGILILTSNRVGIFDEAFKSRIQVALHYENHSRGTRKKIWLNFFEMLEEDEEDVDLAELNHHIDDLAARELNGRQIRNVLTTARQLAMFRKQRLEWSHLLQALSVSSNFSEYLKRMQGHTDDQRARDAGLR